MLIINYEVCLEPQYLDQNIMKHLLNKTKNILEKTCSKEYGHIINVKRIINIIDNNDTLFNLELEIEALKPDVGKKMKGEICMIYKDGIFINVLDRQKILIPASSIKNYVYKKGIYIDNDNNNSLKENDVIEVIITAVRYNKHNFSCLGEIV